MTRHLRPASAPWLRGLSIPKDWRSTQVKRLVRFSSGEMIAAEEVKPEGSFAVYGANGLRGYTDRATHSGARVLVGRVGALCGNVHTVDGDYFASENVLVGEIQTALELGWLRYLLQTMDLGQYSQASAQPMITAGRVGSLGIEVPPLQEQRAIADYLDRETARIDTLIEEQQVLVSLLAERRVAVMAEPFGQAHPTMPLGSTLEELIDHRGKTPGKVGDKTDDFTDEGVPVVSAIHIKHGQISWGERERFVPYWMFEKWMPVRLRTGDVLLTSEAPLGNVAQVPTDAPLVLSQRLFALRGREDVLDSTYLRFFLESDRGQALLRDGTSGSTVSGIRQSRLVQIPVPVPPLDEQRQVSRQIREQIAKIDTLTAETERFIDLSKERRSALITAAVTGQIDVREAA